MNKRALIPPSQLRAMMEDTALPTELELSEIHLIPNHNPRGFMVNTDHFSEHALEELIESIKDKGVLVPILVRPQDDEYELVAGERRYHASRFAGLTRIPVFIQEIPDDQLFEIAAIENTQRQNLSPDALGIQALQYIAKRLEIEPQAVPAAVNKVRNGGEDSRDIVGLLRRVFGMSLSTFSQRYAKVGELSQEERNALLLGRFGIQTLIPLIKLGQRQERKELLEQLVAGKLTKEQLKVEVARLTLRASTLSYSQQVKIAFPKINKLSNENKEKVDKLMRQILEIVNSN